MTKRAGVDAQSISVKDYIVRYESSPLVVAPYARLVLSASSSAVKTQTVFTSVVVDTTTWLPTQIAMRTPVGHSDVTLDYGTADAHPVVVHYRIAQDFYRTGVLVRKRSLLALA